MATPAPEQPNAGNGNRSVTVADPDDYVQTRRLREIHDARERVPTTIREESDRIGDGRDAITTERYHEIITDALVDYIIEVEPLLQDDELDLEEDYWSDYDVSIGDGGGSVTLKKIVDENGEIADGDPMDVEEVRNAFRAVNRFLYDAGIDLEIDQGLPEDKLEP